MRHKSRTAPFALLMPSYRFCRPDDIPRLVAAIDACYRVHVDGEPPMTVARFRGEMKAVDLWPSSCLLAREGDGAVAVLTATKRAEESLISRVGVLPGRERQGHGGHLLTSISQKLAVLGPERLVAELPRDRPDLQAFFAAHDYVCETPLIDWVRAPAPAAPVPEGLLVPITAAAADADDLLSDAGRHRAWQRQRPTLVARTDSLTGAALATPERIEAFALFEASEEAVDIWCLEAAEGPRRDAFLAALIRDLAGRFPDRALCLPRLADDEVPLAVLEANGFEPSTAYDRWAAVATPG